MTLSTILALLIQIAPDVERGALEIIRLVSASQLAAQQAAFVSACLDWIIIPINNMDSLFTSAEKRVAIVRAITSTASYFPDVTAEMIHAAIALAQTAAPPV